MDKISEGKDPSVFLIDTAEKSQEDASRVGFAYWSGIRMISILDLLL
jgi:hypothetical protein